jgi:hypothetical protein
VRAYTRYTLQYGCILQYDVQLYEYELLRWQDYCASRNPDGKSRSVLILPPLQNSSIAPKTNQSILQVPIFETMKFISASPFLVLLFLQVANAQDSEVRTVRRLRNANKILQVTDDSEASAGKQNDQAFADREVLSRFLQSMSL